jgi:predicted ATPase
LGQALFKSIYYLGPLRIKPDRFYTWTGNEPDSVGYSGENTIPAILSARERTINFGYRRERKAFEKIIAEKLQEMGLISSFSINQISSESMAYKARVKTWNSKDEVDLPDVGFGISQVLPVLVECFFAPENSIIIIEQPEIHLHPSAQAALADVMIDVINSRENHRSRNIQLIIETHSEHFLRRLQRRVAEDKIGSNKVSAYFADVTGHPTRLRKLELDLYGDICNWPKGFFGDSFGDAAERATAALNRRISISSEGQDDEALRG